MSLQRRLDAFKSAFESGGSPYNVFRERIDFRAIGKRSRR